MPQWMAICPVKCMSRLKFGSCNALQQPDTPLLLHPKLLAYALHFSPSGPYGCVGCAPRLTITTLGGT